MPETIREVMTRNPVTVSSDSTVVDAARLMRDRDIGPVVVMDGEQVTGIITDRDIVVRAVADGQDPNSIAVQDVCTGDVEAVAPDSPISDVVRRMQQRNVRRLPVVDGDKLVGIISMGDLAIEGELPSSAMADVSAASPNN
jgi:CBS domain-containing protein